MRIVLLFGFLILFNHLSSLPKKILHTPGVFLSICVGHSLQRFQGRFSAAGAG